MKTKLFCFSANKRFCHHDDYFILISKFRNSENIKDFSKKIKIIFSRSSIVFFDIDSKDLIFFPFMILRSIWGGKAIGISVRTQYLYLEHNPDNPKDKYFPLKKMSKKIIFFLIKYFSFTKIYSIHKNTKFDNSIKKFTRGTFQDLQLWDLKYLDISTMEPTELKDKSINLEDHILLAGSLDERRSRNEFLKYINSNIKTKFICAGRMSKDDEDFLKTKDNIIVINRFIENSELFYLMNKCKNIYAFYTNYSPSGFMGRAMQLNKRVIVKSSSYLSENYKDYCNLYEIENLNEINSEVIEKEPSISKLNEFDDSEFFKNIILSL